MQRTDNDKQQWPTLMQQAQQGSQRAYERLLRALLPVIRAQIRKNIYDKVLVDDVIQDVLLTIHRVRHTYDANYPFLPWLMAIIRARCIDALRRQGHHQQRFVDEAILLDGLAADTEDPLSDNALQHYLQQLPPRQREMVEYVHLQENSLADAALHYQLSVSAVKSLLHRALDNLRRIGAKK